MMRGSVGDQLRFGKRDMRSVRSMRGGFDSVPQNLNLPGRTTCHWKITVHVCQTWVLKINGCHCVTHWASDSQTELRRFSHGHGHGH